MQPAHGFAMETKRPEIHERNGTTRSSSDHSEKLPKIARDPPATNAFSTYRPFCS